MRVFRTSPGKTAEAKRVGLVAIDCEHVRRGETVEEWHHILRPSDLNESIEAVGELKVEVRLDELVVFGSDQYAELKSLLITGDGSLDLAYELINAISSGSYEEVTDTLLRVYLAEDTAVERIQQMATKEVQAATAELSVLFRGKSPLTKSLELYLRIVGEDFLQASIGTVVEELCAKRIDLEIDPTKLEPRRDRSIADNVKDLSYWARWLWQSIYEARHLCPSCVLRC